MRGLGHRRRVAAAISLVLGVSVLAFLVSRTSMAEIFEGFRRADPALLMLTVVTGLAVTVLRALRFGFFFPPPPGRRLGLYGVFALFRLVKLALPFHIGEVALLALLKRHGLSPTIAETVPVWVLLRATDLAVVSLVLWLALAAVKTRQEVEILSWMLLAGPAGFAAMLLLPDRWLARWEVRFHGAGWLANRLAAVRAGVRHARHLGRVLATVVVSVLLWLLMAATATLAQLAFASPMPLEQCLAVAIVSQALSILPIHAPLGIGTDDAIWSGMMVAFGMPFEGAVALALAVRATLVGMVAVDSLVGALCLAALGRTRQR